MKIKDRLIAGAIAGLGANLVKIAIEQTAVKMGLSKETGAKRAAGFFITARKFNTPQGKVLGFLADSTIAGFLGVFSSYLLTFTGKDYALLKGAAVGNISWSSMYGVLAQMGASKIKSNDPMTFLTSFISHTAFGITKFYIVTKITDPGLFKPHYESLGVPENKTKFKSMEETEDKEALLNIH